MILCKTLRISVFLPCCFYLKCTILAKPTLKTFIIFAEDPWQYINIARGTTLIASLGNLKKKKNIGSDVKQQKMEMVELGGIVGASFYHSACPYHYKPRSHEARLKQDQVQLWESALTWGQKAAYIRRNLPMVERVFKILKLIVISPHDSIKC